MTRLEDSDVAVRNQAIQFWNEIADLAESKTGQMGRYHFSLSELRLRPEEGSELKLRLLQLPSTFAPEEWSFTFFEGLTRYKTSEFIDRRVVELGCGNGWISLALAIQTRPAQIVGLDINPRAIVCSKLNLYLNAFHADGSPRWSSDGSTLLDRVQFHVSDLLEVPRKKGWLVDRVIGCIPQVLNPDPEFTSKLLTQGVRETESDEFLHSLSNYAAGDSGSIEDQFGLGLIARALEESVDVLRPSGKIILNLGGRPGTAVLQHLFLRRGFTVSRVWHTQVSQAKDTDIQALVEIESKTPHRFEFYMGRGTDSPVCATTALAYAEAGGEIAHGLSVYEARMRDPIAVKKIIKYLRGKQTRNSIDLSYTDGALAEEKMAFLAGLTDRLGENAMFPYEATEGLASFRRRIAVFFRNYFRIPWAPENVLITPSLATSCQAILQLYRPKVAAVDAQLIQGMRERGIPLRSQIIEIPKRADLACELLEKLKPELMIYSLTQSEGRSRDAFDNLVSTSQKTGTRLVLDISDLLELSSTPPTGGLFSALSEGALPPTVTLVCGLLKNRLYQDLEAAFVVSENRDFLHQLTAAADLTYSRTPYFNQLYYERLLSDLLNFQLTETRLGSAAPVRELAGETDEIRKRFVRTPDSVVHAFRHPAVHGDEQASSRPDTVRLDYGENSLPAPSVVAESVFEAFSKMHLGHSETDPLPEIFGLTKERFGWARTDDTQGVLGIGISPLFSAIAEYCAAHDIPLLFPAGSYGHFVASAQFHGARIETVAGAFDRQFKITPKLLNEALTRTNGRAWFVLNAPLVNPTGIRYSSEELDLLLEVAEAHGAPVLLDALFSGLEFSSTDTPTLLRRLGTPGSKLRFALLGGLSKEFAAGGLRLGYALSSDMEILQALRGGSYPAPHSTLRYAMKKTLQTLLEKNPAIVSELGEQRHILKQRADRLTEVLKSTGWEPLPSSGGLFLVAHPSAALLARKLDGKKLEVQTLANELHRSTGVLINSPEWTGIPGFFRFVLSVPDSDFEQALIRLGEFFRKLS